MRCGAWRLACRHGYRIRYDTLARKVRAFDGFEAYSNRGIVGDDRHAAKLLAK